MEKQVHLSRIRVLADAMATQEAAIGPLLATPSTAVFELPQDETFDPHRDLLVQMIAKEYTVDYGGDLSPDDHIGFLGVVRSSPQTRKFEDDFRIPTDDELEKIKEYCDTLGIEIVDDR